MGISTKTKRPMDILSDTKYETELQKVKTITTIVRNLHDCLIEWLNNPPLNMSEKEFADNERRYAEFKWELKGFVSWF